MGDVETSVGPVRVRELGPADGPVVLFVHGVLVDGRLWDPVATRLAAEGWRCVVPDLPLGSHRLPMRPGADRSPRGIVAAIADLLEHLGADDVTLVGSDTGGALCQFLLDTRPARVGRVVLTNCDGFDVFPPFPFDVVFRIFRSPGRLRLIAQPMRSTALRHSPLGFGLLVTDPDPGLTLDWLEPVLTDRAIREDLSALLEAIDAAELYAVSSRMTDVQIPVRLVWGMADRAFKPAICRRLHDRFADSEWRPVPGARTFVSLDAPEAVAAAVHDR